MNALVTDMSDDNLQFRRGHRVRFANGPVMTVTGFCPGDYRDKDTDMIICAWWPASEELCFAVFHPDLLIHAQEAAPVVAESMTDADFIELHTE
jgi:uncharacterized protein YodC (DUF2158 family)